MLSPIYPGMTDDLQLGEGVLIAGVPADVLLARNDPAAVIAGLGSDALLGATAAGCTFRVQPALLHTEARGRRTPCAGTTLTGPVTASLSGILLAFSPANAARLLNLPLPQRGQATILTGDAAALPVTAPCLVWIGDTASGLALIELKNPVSTGGMQLHARPCGAGETAFTFLAQQDGPQDPALPFRLIWLREDPA